MEEKEIEKVIALIKLREAGFMDDAELRTAVQARKISKEALIHVLTRREAIYLRENAAILLSDTDGTDVTTALITAVLPGGTESQKRIAKIVKQRPDYAKVREQVLKAI